MHIAPWMWVAFSVIVFGLLALDLGVVNRRAHVPSTREALGWSAAWVGVAAAFGLGVGHFLGRDAALSFAAAYLTEEALSVDNLFVFLVLFAYFRVPDALRHRVLFWGILGALVMRGVMIAAGALMLERFEWLLYVFGAFLIFTAGRMAFGGGDHVDPSHNPVLRLVRRLLPVTRGYRGTHFFVREAPPDGGAPLLSATPLFVVLALVETTDLVFAVDSIPAVFGITREPFIVYTSNVFAILGLRSLFFVLAGVMERFHLLGFGLAGVLAFVGVKMLLAERWHVPVGGSLAVIAGCLGVSVIASLLIAPKPGAAALAGGLAPDGTDHSDLVTVEGEEDVEAKAAALPTDGGDPPVSAAQRPR